MKYRILVLQGDFYSIELQLNNLSAKNVLLKSVLEYTSQRVVAIFEENLQISRDKFLAETQSDGL